MHYKEDLTKKIIISSLGLLFLFSLPTLGEIELVGRLSEKEILDNFPEWREVADSYAPNLEVIEKLRALDKTIRIEVFLATWCPDCKKHVSAYFKIMEMVENPFISTSYTGIPKDLEARQQFIQGKNIERVPTFIIYFQNQEIGRIIETPAKSVEEDLTNIIEKLDWHNRKEARFCQLILF